jgi:hypothetical protein
MPVSNNNLIKAINNPNRFVPQPGGSLMNRTGMTGKVFNDTNYLSLKTNTLTFF